MPAFAAHSLFGDEVLKKLPSFLCEAVSRNRAAFWYGLFGPDVLFFSDTVWKREHSLNRLGVRMHKEQIPQQFIFLLEWASAPGEGRDIALSYAAGYLCHYRLDSMVHPYVYALCGVSHEKHNRMESDMDSLLLAARSGKEVTAYRARPPFPSEISAARRVAADWFGMMGKKIYGIKVQKGAAVRAFGEMEFCSRRMFSQGKAVAVLCSAADRLTHAGIGAFLRRKTPDITVLNEEHREWEDPYTGERSQRSYLEMEAEAACLAAADIAALYGCETCEPKRTFSGRPLGNGERD